MRSTPHPSVEGCPTALADPLLVASPGQQVLLLGGHAGSLIELARRGVFATAVHASPIAVGSLSDEICAHGVRGLADAWVMDPCSPAFPPGTFDLVFVDDDVPTNDFAAACANWSALLREGGSLIATGRDADSWIGSAEALARLMDAFQSVEVDAAEWLTSLPLLRSAEPRGPTHRWLDALDRASLRALPFTRRFARRLVVRCHGPRAPQEPRSVSPYAPATPAAREDVESGAAFIRELSDPKLAQWQAVDFLED